jgi:tetratricopeptide (TPR) repeat protein
MVLRFCLKASGFLMGLFAAISPLLAAMPQDQARQLIDQAYAKTEKAEAADDFAEIIRLCRQAQSQQPKPPLDRYLRSLLSWAHNRRGEVYADKAARLLDAGETTQARESDEKALADFEKAVEYDATRFKPLHNRGVSKALIGKYEEAIADFTRVAEMNPEYSNAWFNLGEIRSEMGDFKKAAADYSKAIELDPQDAKAWVGRGVARLRLQLASEALQDLERALELAPDEADSLAQRGDAHQCLGNWERAAEDFRRANDLDKQSAAAYRGAAWLMATCPEERFRKPELAIQAATRAIELAGSSDYRLLDTLAAAYANAGKFEEAVQTVEKAIHAVRDLQVADVLRRRLALYREKKPYRMGETPTERSNASANSNNSNKNVNR